MEKIGAGFKVCEEEDDGATAHDHQSPPLNNLRRFGSSEIRLTLSLNVSQENNGGTLAAVPRNSKEPPVYSPMPLRWFHSDFDFRSSDQINGVGESVCDDDEGVDLTLWLFPPSASRNPSQPIVSNRSISGRGSSDVVSLTVKDEMNTELDLSLSLSLSIMPLCGEKVKPNKSEKRGRSETSAGEAGTEKKKRRVTKRKCGDGEEQQPSIPIEEIPILDQTLESRGGTRPVFLYKKRLEESDVLKDQNRLLVTRAERLMEFLREEETAAVNGGPGRGLKFVGVDGGGRVYEKMGLTKWAKSKVTVINSDWRKIVEANAAKRGDVVKIWGCRENQKLCLAFSFV